MKKFSIAAFVIVLLMLVLFMVPASLMGTLLEKASNQKISMSDTEGTLWSGSGFISVIDEENQSHALTEAPLVWTIEKLPLLWGEVSGMLAFSKDRQLNDDGRAAHFRASRSEGQIDGISIPINVAAVSKLHRNVELMRLGGAVTVDIRQVFWQHGMMTMDAALLWQHMRSGLVQLPSVGSYQVSFDAKQADKADIDLTTLEGPLLLSAKGKMSGSGFMLEGTAEAEDADRSDLQNLLMVIGRERNGVRYFRFSAGSI